MEVADTFLGITEERGTVGRADKAPTTQNRENREGKAPMRAARRVTEEERQRLRKEGLTYATFGSGRLLFDLLFLERARREYLQYRTDSSLGAKARGTGVDESSASEADKDEIVIRLPIKRIVLIDKAYDDDTCDLLDPHVGKWPGERNREDKVSQQLQICIQFCDLTDLFF